MDRNSERFLSNTSSVEIGPPRRPLPPGREAGSVCRLRKGREGCTACRGRSFRRGGNKLFTILAVAICLCWAGSGHSYEVPYQVLDAHPRLILSHQGLRALQDMLQSKDHPLLEKMVQQLRDYTQHEIMGREPLRCNEPSHGSELIWTARCVLERVYFLSLLHWLEPLDPRSPLRPDPYAERAWQELEAASHVEGWDKGQCIVGAEIVHAFAIAYDWLHPYFSGSEEGQKRLSLIRAFIIDKGLKPALAAYLDPDATKYRWRNEPYNLNLVCNSGYTIAALAIHGECPHEPGLCDFIIQNAVQCLKLYWFDPDGGWPEGTTYWNYGTRYLGVLLAALETALEKDSELVHLIRQKGGFAGFTRTGLFPLYMTGPSGLPFNYGDADPWLMGAPQTLYLSQEFPCGPCLRYETGRVEAALSTPEESSRELRRQDAPGDRDFALQQMPLFPLYLIWYPRIAAGIDPPPALDWAGALPRDQHFRSKSLNDVFSLREGWDKPEGWFLGFRFGSNDILYHGHLDLGAFVLDYFGKRWAVDLGKPEVYTLPCYGRRTRPTPCRETDLYPWAYRYTYFRTRAEAHNTLVIKPSTPSPVADDKPDQKIRGDAPVIADSTAFPYRNGIAIGDLGGVYDFGPLEGQISRVWRGLALLRKRTLALIQDEIESKVPVDIWWFMYTPAEVLLQKQGRSVTLRQYDAGKGKNVSIQLNLHCPQVSEAVFEATPVDPRDPSLRLSRAVSAIEEGPFPGLTRLVVRLKNQTSLRLAVSVIPLDDNGSRLADPPVIYPLIEWPSRYLH